MCDTFLLFFPLLRTGPTASLDRREPPVHGGFPTRSKLHSAQIGALLRVAIRATTIPPIQPLARGFPEVSSCHSAIVQG